MENEIYMAVDKICSERESNGSYRGNSHHLSQEITGAVMQVITARQSKGSAEQQTDNSDYTAALEAEIRDIFVSESLGGKESSIHWLATRLNSVVKAQQNCA